MDGFVYIRYKNEEWGWLDKIKVCKCFDGLIECVAKKYYGDKKCIGKAKDLIVSDANNLLNLRKQDEGLNDEDLIVYHRVSLRQISKLRRPKNGYTSCYSGIILMAIINLLCSEAGLNVSEDVKKLCSDDNVDFLEAVIKEQYTDILRAFRNRQGEFRSIDSYQYKLASYYNESCNNFNHHYPNHTYAYVAGHLSEDNVFDYTDSVPCYRTHDLTR